MTLVVLNKILAFLVTLGVLILIHELGHYAIARLCDVKVLRFSIGFGRPLWLRRGRGPDRTEWVVAALPLGGFVRMLDEREGPVDPAEAHRAFNRQSVWRRIAIVAAGPIANFLLAIAVYAGIYMVGVSEPRAVLGAPEPGTAAAIAGIRAGDQIQSLNGTPVATWQDARWTLLDLAVARKTAVLEVIDEKNAIVTRRLDLSGARIDDMEGDPLARLGLRLYRPPVPAVIGVLEAGGAARAAGMREGDRIVAVDDAPVAMFEDLVKIVVAKPGEPLRVQVERADGARETLAVTPRAVERDGKLVGRIGAGPRIDRERLQSLMIEERYGPLAAIVKGTVKTWEMSVFSLKMLWKMIVGDLSWRNLSGPVTIADYAGQSASLGVLPFLTFIALVSISLGVLNLLPIPVLDGGHLLYYFVEVLKGTPLSDRTMELGQRVGVAILLGLMAFAFYNDINRLFAG
jgi:regulator of sigma E protease